MILDLTDNEVQSIVNVLNELPTKSNAYPLVQKILLQAQAQAEPEEQEEAA